MSQYLYLLRRWLRLKLARYEVMVEWEGQRIAHYEWTYEQAMAWVRLYPRGSAVAVGCRYGCGVVALRAA